MEPKYHGSCVTFLSAKLFWRLDDVDCDDVTRYPICKLQAQSNNLPLTTTRPEQKKKEGAICISGKLEFTSFKPGQTYSNNGYCYYVSDKEITGYKAPAFCHSIANDKNLVSLSKISSQSYVFINYLLSHDSFKKYFWVNLKYSL